MRHRIGVNMKKIKNIGLVAHDARKKDLVEWVKHNEAKLCKHRLICTGTTGRLIEELYNDGDHTLMTEIIKLKSGPLGGDQQMGALIAEGKIDILIFFVDPLSPQPHDVDVKALERLCVVYNVVIASTRSTADFVITSPLFDDKYKPTIVNYSAYLHRNLNN